MIKTKRNSKRNSKRNNNRNKRNTKNKNKTLRKYKKLSGGANGNARAPVARNLYDYDKTLGTTGYLGASNTQFNYPAGVAVSAKGDRIYVADTKNNRVQIFDGTTNPPNYIATLGTEYNPDLDTDNVGPSNTQFQNTYGIAVSATDTDEKIYIVDCFNHRVQIFDVSDIKNIRYIANLGTTGSAGTDDTHFNKPSGVAVSATGDRIYVADSGNNRIQIFNGNTLEHIKTLGTGYNPDLDTGKVVLSNTQFSKPSGVAVSATGDRIYVADTNNHRVQIFDGESYNYIAGLGTNGASGISNKQFTFPHGIAVSATGDRIYVADQFNQRVQIFNFDLNNTPVYDDILGITQTEGNRPRQFRNPVGVAVSADGVKIFVADTLNHRVQIWKKKT